MGYFDTVIGQDTIKEQLTELVQRQVLPHSLLFYGESGLGKLDMAFGLASTLVGRPVFSSHKGHAYLEQTAEARLANGESQKKIDAEGLPLYMDKGDVFWLRPMKQTLKVEQWYSLLQDHLNVAGNGNRVVIVEDFHTANAIMANAMLKTIEEPPSQVYFIIVTDKINTVLPTIVSRCMGVAFRAVDDDSIRQALMKEGITHNIDQALLTGPGNPALVRQLAEEQNIAMLDLAIKVMDALAYENRWFTLISLWTEQLSREDLGELLHWLRLVGRDMLALKNGATQAELQLPTKTAQLTKLLSRWSTKALARIVPETLQAESALRLHIKTALVMDGISIALHKARQED